MADRPEDIPLLANYFVQRFKRKFAKDISRIDRGSMKALMSYGWPGNIRELEHVIERAVLISEDPILRIPPLSGISPEPASSGDFGPHSHVGRVRTLAEAEKEHISEVVQMTKGLVAGKGGAAEVLGVPQSTLRNRMKKLGIKSYLVLTFSGLSALLTNPQSVPATVTTPAIPRAIHHSIQW